MRKYDFALDKTIAILTLCIGILFTVVPLILKHYSVQIPLIISISSLVYLLFRGKLSQIGDLPRFGEINRIRSLNHIFFIVFLSLIMWVLWSNLYDRSPLYFTLLLLAAASIVLDIFSLNEEKISQVSIGLSKIVALGLITYAGIYFQFPNIYGVDPWLHTGWIQETVNLGHITEGEFISTGQYYLFPAFHLTGAMTQILTSLPTYSSVFASVGVMMALSSVFVFLIGRELFDTKIGLLAALIVSLTDIVIERATAIIPMSLGFCFFLAILYLVFSLDKKRRLRYSVLIMILSVCVILTHSIAAVVTLLGLIAIFAGTKLYKQMRISAVTYEAVSLTLVTFFGLAMFLRWMQNPPGASTFFDLHVEKLVTAYQTGAEFALSGATLPPANIPYMVTIIDQGGYLLLLTFGIIGALIHLHPRNCTGQRIALISVAAVLIVIPYITVLSGVGQSISGRWLIFSYVPLSILAVQGLIGVSNLIRVGLGKLGLAMIMIVVLAILFLMTAINNWANDDSPFLYNGTARIGYTQSEITAIETLSDLEAGYPVTDRYYRTIFPYIISYNRYEEMIRRDNSVFILRNYYLHHPEWNEKYVTKIYHKIGTGGQELVEVKVSDYMRERGIDKAHLIYSNGNIWAYAMPETILE